MKPKNKQKTGTNKDQSRNQQPKKQKNNGEINENKIWFFEKLNSIDKPLVRMDQGQREDTNDQYQE